MIELDGIDLDWTPSGETMLDAICDGRVFGISKAGDKFMINEECDTYFHVLLTKDQMLLLAEEIKALANS